LNDGDTIYPGMHLIIPPKKPLIDVNAYSYQPEDEGIDSLNKVGKLLTFFSPFAYMIKEDGTLQPIEDQGMTQVAISQHIVPMMAITNFSSTQTGANLAHIILSDSELSRLTIANAIQIMEEKGYTVLNVDFENVLPEDREN